MIPIIMIIPTLMYNSTYKYTYIHIDMNIHINT